MDGGPFRVPQSAERRAVNRPEQARRQSVQQPADDPRPAKQPTSTPRSKSRGLPGWVTIVIGIVAIALLAAGGWFAWKSLSGGSLIANDKYQAVFFTNGQVYFGKLSTVDSDYMRLTNVYYLRTQAEEGEAQPENPQNTSADQTSMQLIKLGGEVHGPEDEMIISKDQVLFYENLKPDGKVSKSISDNEQQ